MIKISRLSNVLGIQENIVFKFLYEVKNDEIYKADDYKIIGEYLYIDISKMIGYDCWRIVNDGILLCRMINNPELIYIEPFSNIITPAQITNIVSMMSSGWHYVVNDGGTITCYKTKPWIDKEDGYYTRSITNINASKELFNFVKRGECVYLPDLIKGILK